MKIQTVVKHRKEVRDITERTPYYIAAQMRKRLGQIEQEWQKQLVRMKREYPEDALAQAACIAWWDHYANEPIASAYKDLDDLVLKFDFAAKPENATVELILRDLGYTTANAKRKAYFRPAGATGFTGESVQMITERG